MSNLIAYFNNLFLDILRLPQYFHNVKLFRNTLNNFEPSAKYPQNTAAVPNNSNILTRI